MKKMRPAKTVPGMGGGEIKENDGGGNSIMTYCRNFCNGNSYHQHNKKQFLKTII
jgi:hypothetical protein